MLCEVRTVHPLAGLPPRVLVGRVAPPVPLGVHDVVGGRRKEDGEAVAVREREACLVGFERAALVKDEDLRLVPQAVLQGAGEDEAVVLGGHGSVMGVGQFDRAGVAARFFRRQPRHEHLIGMAAKILAAIGHAAAAVRDADDGLGEVQFAAVFGGVGVSRQPDEQVAECLVPTHAAVLAGGVFAAGPEAVHVELEAFLGHLAEDHGAQSAVADGQGLLLPPRCRLLVPERHRPARRLAGAGSLRCDGGRGAGECETKRQGKCGRASHGRSPSIRTASRVVDSMRHRWAPGRSGRGWLAWSFRRMTMFRPKGCTRRATSSDSSSHVRGRSRASSGWFRQQEKVR